jgi:nucleoside-diphosphate-sugar epimerase
VIVVTTPTGKIGSHVIPHLLAADETVRVVARDPSKLSLEIRNSVEIVIGSLDDEAVIGTSPERCGKRIPGCASLVHELIHSNVALPTRLLSFSTPNSRSV